MVEYLVQHRAPLAGRYRHAGLRCRAQDRRHAVHAGDACARRSRRPDRCGRHRLFGWYNTTVSLMRGKGIVAVALVLLLISATSVWWAVLLLAYLLYLAGYPAIQFQPRHFFHLEFVAWWAFGVLLERAVAGIVTFVRARRGGDARPTVSLPAVRRMATFALDRAGGPGSAVRGRADCTRSGTSARTAQPVCGCATRCGLDRRGPIRRAHAAAGARVVERSRSHADGRHAVPRRPVLAGGMPGGQASADIPIRRRQGATGLFVRHRRHVPAAASPVESIFPAYDVADKTRFAGIEVSRGFERCVEQVSRVRDLRPTADAGEPDAAGRLGRGPALSDAWPNGKSADRTPISALYRAAARA